MAIPTIDLSHFFTETSDDHEKEKAKEIIKQACSEYGFFQIVNHGIPIDLTRRALDLSKTFFAFPDEEKLKCSPTSIAPLPAGYNTAPDRSLDKNEYLLILGPESLLNNLPENPPGFKYVIEEMFCYFRKLGEIIETILNDCLGLPNSYLKEYNNDRSWDFMTAWHYPPATETENYDGLYEHEDGNVVTFVIQENVGGLQVLNDGKWIPIDPDEAKIVVNISDVIQVLSNNKFKSVTHRVVRSKERTRNSFSFFYNIQGDKWVEPLPHFTNEIGEKPKYRGFLYKEYQALRMRNKTLRIRPEEFYNIKHYAISD